MAGKLLDRQGIQQWILRKLGAPLLRIELTQDHLDDCVDEACHWFSAKKGFRTSIRMLVAPGTVEYKLPDDVDVVYDVVFAPQGGAYDLDRIVDPMGLVDQMPSSMWSGAGSTSGLLSTYAQTIQYLDVARRVLGTDMEWRQEGRNLLIMGPLSSNVVILDYKSNNFTIEQLSERDHDLVKRFSMAEAKETLGRIRSKFNTFPGAQGGTDLDGDKLLQEAHDEFEKLDEEIGASAYPMAFLIG